jgi:uncharacterized protein (TIGR03546 family)
LRIFSAERSPRQLAWGIAIGMMVGLVPKGNLLAVGLAMLLFGLRVNLGMGLTAVFLVSLVGPMTDQLSHGIGMRVLRTPWIYRLLAAAYELPLVPWTSLNNTVVLGSVILGGVLCYPTFHVSHRVAEQLQPVWRRLRRNPKNLPAAPPDVEAAVQRGAGPARATITADDPSGARRAIDPAHRTDPLLTLDAFRARATAASAAPAQAVAATPAPAAVASARRVETNPLPAQRPGPLAASPPPPDRSTPPRIEG